MKTIVSIALAATFVVTASAQQRFAPVTTQQFNPTRTFLVQQPVYQPSALQRNTYPSNNWQQPVMRAQGTWYRPQPQTQWSRTTGQPIYRSQPQYPVQQHPVPRYPQTVVRQYPQPTQKFTQPARQFYPQSARQYVQPVQQYPQTVVRNYPTQTYPRPQRAFVPATPQAQVPTYGRPMPQVRILAPQPAQQPTQSRPVVVTSPKPPKSITIFAKDRVARNRYSGS